MAQETLKEIKYNNQKVVVEVAKRDSQGRTIHTTYQEKLGTNVIPVQSTANKLLISTSTAGTSKWTDGTEGEGLVKLDENGVFTIDSTTYATTTALNGKMDKLSSTTDNAIVRFNGTAGAIQQSGLSIDDSGNLVKGSYTFTFPTKSGQIAIGGDTPSPATATPLMDGVASVGTSDKYAREDHKHPTDTSRLSNAPDGTHNFLDSNNKINTVYIPDSLLGQIVFKGTFDASSTTGVVSDPQDGWYYIATTGGRYNPDGTDTGTANNYAIGDWAIYRQSTGWEKVANTDAVTMVNSQTGAIQTYKGEWTPNTSYYRGDIVLNSNTLYLCKTTHTSSSTFVNTNWISFTNEVPSWALQADKPTYTFSEIQTKPTTIAGYGITDALINNGVITLGSNSITPITDISGKVDKRTSGTELYYHSTTTQGGLTIGSGLKVDSGALVNEISAEDFGPIDLN